MRVSQWLLILWVKAEASDGGSNASGAGGASMRVKAVARHHRWLHHHPMAPRPPPYIYIYICVNIVCVYLVVVMAVEQVVMALVVVGEDAWW